MVALGPDWPPSRESWPTASASRSCARIARHPIHNHNTATAMPHSPNSTIITPAVPSIELVLQFMFTVNRSPRYLHLRFPNAADRANCSGSRCFCRGRLVHRVSACASVTALGSFAPRARAFLPAPPALLRCAREGP